jgi:homoserine kinase
MALDVWNELIVERASEFSMSIEGEGEGQIPMDETNLVVDGMRYAFKAAGKELPPCKYHLKNSIPFCRGMGSSSAAIVAGLVAGCVMSGHELRVKGEEGLLQLACEIEGHPDNVAPAIYGGLQIGVHTGSRWYTSRVNIPHGMQCVVFVPNFTTSTKESRAMLPEKVPMHDAVFNIGHAAMMVNAFATNNFEELKVATIDRLHQPLRGTVLKHLVPLIGKAPSMSCSSSAFSPIRSH